MRFTTGMSKPHEAVIDLSQFQKFGASIEHLGVGLNAYVYRLGETVVKASKKPLIKAEAESRLELARSRYNLISYYLGDLVQETSHQLARDQYTRDGWRVISTQDFTQGPRVAEAKGFDRDTFLELLSRSAWMYKETLQIPDVAAVEFGFFDPLKTPNIIIQPDLQPVLVDTDYGKIQSHPVLGVPWSALIHNGVKRGIKKLRATH